MNQDEKQRINRTIAKAHSPVAVFCSDKLSLNGGGGWMPLFTDSVDSCLKVMPKSWDGQWKYVDGRIVVTLILPESEVRPERRYGGVGINHAEALAEAIADAIDGGEKP